MSEPCLRENIVSLGEYLCWCMQEYGSCALLEGATAFVGFDECKEKYTNYFLCDGVADDVQIQAAIDYVLGLGLAGKATVIIGAGQYTFTGVVDIESNMTLVVYGEIVKGFAGSPFRIHGVLGTRKTDIDIIGGIYDGNKAAFPDNNPFFSVQYAEHLLFEDMYFYDVATGGDNGYGIKTMTGNTCDWIRVLNCRGETSFGLVSLDAIDNFIIAENFCFDNDIDIRIVGCKYGVVADNDIYGGIGGGITVLGGSNHVQVTGNTVAYKDKEGIAFAQADYCSAVGNTLHHNTMGAFKCWDFNYCLIGGNHLVDNACSAPGGDMPVSAQISCYTSAGGHESQYNVVEGNFIYSTGTVAPNVLYGIGEIEAGGLGLTDNNTYKDNYISGHATSPGIFVGDNNVYNAKSTTFTYVENGGTLTIDGAEINAVGERAVGWIVLPSDVHSVIKVKYYARSKVIEADGMRVQVFVHGGASNENFENHITNVNITSTTTNFIVSDIIYWTIENAAVIALSGGDAVKVQAWGLAADGADCATDAYMYAASLEYI